MIKREICVRIFGRSQSPRTAGLAGDGGNSWATAISRRKSASTLWMAKSCGKITVITEFLPDPPEQPRKKMFFFYISVGILSPNFHRSADNSPENTCIKRKHTKMTFFIIKNPQRSDFYRSRRIWICRTRSASRRSGRWRLGLWSEDTTIAAPAAVDLDWSGATNRQIDGTRCGRG